MLTPHESSGGPFVTCALSLSRSFGAQDILLGCAAVPTLMVVKR